MIARIALAHKLATAAYHMIKEGRPFDHKRLFGYSVGPGGKADEGGGETTKSDELTAWPIVRDLRLLMDDPYTTRNPKAYQRMDALDLDSPVMYYMRHFRAQPHDVGELPNGS